MVTDQQIQVVQQQLQQIFLTLQNMQRLCQFAKLKIPIGTIPESLPQDMKDRLFAKYQDLKLLLIEQMKLLP